MVLRGYIDEIGVPREWTSKKTNETCCTYPITLSIEYVNAKGETKSDKIRAEHMAGNPDYIAKLEQIRKNKTRCEFSLSFKLREWEGKTFQDITLWDVVVLMDKG